VSLAPRAGSTPCELRSELGARVVSHGLITQPIGDLGDGAHLDFDLVSVHQIAQLHANVAVPNMRSRR